ncbi:carbohydrate ABC transporter permease [Pyrobaculum aerophilum]|uniref:ABC transporter permease n=1 Tax=Pyrobaculum aerophilum TaxID=13773 RepID=A0A371R2U5_9CREN|nr:ABC transporter permease [Pyrobaculum aerophilum]RFA98980.1 ABC transporter permease [Pyrobaculum aerophilum]
MNRKILNYFVFLIPPLIFVGIFTIYPVFASFVYSFYTGSGFGLDNYIKVITDTNPLRALVMPKLDYTPPWGALIHNVVWIAIHVPLVTVLGLVLAYVLKYYVVGSNLVKGIVFIGMVIPPAIGGVIIRFMFDKDIGVVPIIFSALGIKELATTWINYPNLALYALILGSVWIWLGFAVTVFSAAIEAIPKSHIDAARVFGASDWHIFRRIVVPEVKPAVIIVVVMTALWDMKIFDIVFAATGGGPGGATNVLALVMYNYFARLLDYFKAATVAVILTALVVPFVIIAIRRWL